MSYIRSLVSVDRRPFDTIERNVKAAPRLLATATRREIGKIASDFIKEAGTPLGAHRRPTRWQNPKQQKYWFWALKMGIIVWNGRTGALEKGWKRTIAIDDNGGLFSVYNTQASKIFVQGIYQQVMHRGVWANEDQLVQKYRLIAQGRLMVVYRTIFDPFAGVPQSGG